MVRLALRTRSPPSRPHAGLRGSAVWYPAIPPPNLSLNEEAFLLRDLYTVGYKPLFWGHFGGPGGKYLRHLTGILAVSSVGILRIYFSFDVEVPWEHRSFGRVKVDEEYEESTDFSIDGPGGERIETIKMRHYYDATREENMPGAVRDKEGYMIRCEVSTSLPFSVQWALLTLAYLKFYTNRGRSCRIFKLKRKGHIVHTKVTAAPGTAITGLYATEVRKMQDTHYLVVDSCH